MSSKIMVKRKIKILTVFVALFACSLFLFENCYSVGSPKVPPEISFLHTYHTPCRDIKIESAMIDRSAALNLFLCGVVWKCVLGNMKRLKILIRQFEMINEISKPITEEYISMQDVAAESCKYLKSSLIYFFLEQNFEKIKELNWKVVGFRKKIEGFFETPKYEDFHERRWFFKQLKKEVMNIDLEFFLLGDAFNNCSYVFLSLFSKLPLYKTGKKFLELVELEGNSFNMFCSIKEFYKKLKIYESSCD